MKEVVGLRPHLYLWPKALGLTELGICGSKAIVIAFTKKKWMAANDPWGLELTV